MHSIYVLELSTGIVKLGGSENYDKRIKEHRANAQRYGFQITRVWVQPVDNFFGVEKLALVDMNRLGTAHGRESFSGLSYEQAIEILETAISNYVPTPPELRDPPSSVEFLEDIVSCFENHQYPRALNADELAAFLQITRNKLFGIMRDYEIPARRLSAYSGTSYTWEDVKEAIMKWVS